MPSSLKKRVRARMDKTGETYQTALRHVRGGVGIQPPGDTELKNSPKAPPRTVQAQRTICTSCGAPGSRSNPVCDACGARGREIDVWLNEEPIDVKERLDAKVKNDHFGRKPKFEIRSEDSLYRKTNQWHRLARVIDRENDRYDKTVANPTTGEIVYECHEPLSHQQGRGSARSSG